MTTKILHLHVKREYFEAIASGEKKEEYRAYEKWAKRIVNIDYDYVQIYLGYPKKGDWSRAIRFRFNGYRKKTLNSKIYGGNVKVLAIDLSRKCSRPCHI